MPQEVLLVEDSPAQAAVYAGYLEAEGFHPVAVESGEAALEAIVNRAPAAILLDLELPGIHGLEVMARLRDRGMNLPVIVITDHGSSDNVAEAMRLGALDFVTKPFSRDRLKVTLGNVLRTRELTQLVDHMRVQFQRDRYQGFLGASLPMQALYRIIESVGPSRATVFITGESGTGKELCAAAIHAASPRCAGAFVAVNCAALPHDLMESEVFGHVKGAFTGAHRQREGAASLADGGTLFLDEIGEMNLELQAKLLRFVQTGQLQRVGSGETIQVDVRIVCATNRDPLEMVRQGRFREDLYYRLHVVPVSMPALRERGTDILMLARSFLERFAAEDGKQFAGFSPEAEHLLMRHPWPGNVRELENLVRNIVVLQAGGAVTAGMLPVALTLRDLPPPRSAAPVAPVPIPIAHSNAEPAPVPVIRPMWQVERETIEAAISLCDGNVPRAAAALGISPSTIYRKRLAWSAGGVAGC